MARPRSCDNPRLETKRLEDSWDGLSPSLMVSPEVGRMGVRYPSQPTMMNTRRAPPHRVVERLSELVIHVKLTPGTPRGL